jgi:hypothetical protein
MFHMSLKIASDFLIAFIKLQKATFSFVMSVCPSVHPYGTSWLPLDGILVNLILELFSKIVKKIQVLLKSTRITGTVHEVVFTVMTVSPQILRRMRNVLDKSCRENKNTHFMFTNFFTKIVPFIR